MRHWKVGSNYDILTSKGRVEAQVSQPHVAIFAANYKDQRWHGRLDRVEVGEDFDGGVIQLIRERT